MSYGSPPPMINSGLVSPTGELPPGFQPVSPGASAAQSGFGSAGMMLMAASAVSQAIGSFYSAKTQQMQLKMQQENLLFQSRMANRAATAAYVRAQEMERAGQQAVGRYTMQAGAAKSTAKTQLAARGIQAGKGSAAEIMATFDLVRGIDALTITSNSIRAANAERMRGAAMRGQAAVSAASGQAYGLAAGAITPALSGVSSLLGSAANIYMAGQAMDVQSRRYSEMMQAYEGAG
jgi:hypothetical protein